MLRFPVLSPASTRRLPAILATALLAAFFLQSFLASRLKSPTSDEPVHIGAGLSYVSNGVFVANREHPPLLKELAGLALLANGVRYPDSWMARQLMAGGSPAVLERPIGNSIIAENGPDRVLFWARLPLALVGTMLGAVIFLWGRQIAGDWAALGAVFLYALDPTIIAHSSLVTTDVGFAAFGALFLYALYNYQRRPTITGLVLCGLALGAALCTKFSAVFLLPIAAIFLRAALKWPPEASGAKHPHPWLDLGAHKSAGKRSFLVYATFAAICAIASLIIDICYLSPNGVVPYVRGLFLVNANHDPTFTSFMAGHIAHRFVSYFAVAYLLKEPIASIILAALGAAIVFRRKSFPTLAKLYLFVAPAIIFLSYVAGADDIGIRYIIPVLPFAYLFGGIALAELARGQQWQKFAAAALCVWLAVAAVGIYPDHLSYFNESACLLKNPSEIGFDGGTRCGPLWLDDSNVDWGQGLKQLDSWLDQNAKGRDFRFFYFGSFPPQDYGLHFDRQNITDLASNPLPGLYVISAHAIGAFPALGDFNHTGDGQWLRTTQPTAIVGHALYVYDLRSALASHPPSLKNVSANH
jgi:hypothetical protein